MQSIIRKGIAAAFLLSLSLGAANAAEPLKKNRKSRAQSQFDIKVTPWGATPEQVESAKSLVEKSAAVQSYLEGKNFRLLSFSYVENENKKGLNTPPTNFRAVFYDYDGDRAIVALGSFSNPSQVTVTEEFYQPESDVTEYEAAVAVLEKDEAYSAAHKAGMLKTYAPMPPTTVLDGTTERLVNVGVEAEDGSVPHAVVGVSLKRGVVVRYENNAPPTCIANLGSCGVPNANQTTTTRGTAGQYQLRISKDNVTLWEMLVIRPSASAGNEGSGIELQDVRYRGKSVLKRGGVPVLNVQYLNNVCGPYRDWQYSEGTFQTPDGLTDVAPGIRIIPAGQRATTVVDTGSDSGNFRGVAIYTAGTETVMVTELNAGWYRYIMEWRFDEDGTIRPRFGFGSVSSSCVCSGRNHHVYWRLDFDVAGTNNQASIVERIKRGGGRLPLESRPTRYTPVNTEMTFLRNYATSKSLLVKNSDSGDAYMLTPPTTDGTTDAYGTSDFWVLRYKNVVGGTPRQNELSDQGTGGTFSTAINLNPYLNGESVQNQDLVVWYGAHLFRDSAAMRNPLGPEIRPVSW